MTGKFVITGTDTDIGKTVFAAALTHALDGYYWKPVQAGTDGGTDSQRVVRLTQISPDHILPERYVLQTPASPHYAAAQEGLTLDPAALVPPTAPGPLVIEGAGGALVPITPEHLYADLFAKWQIPVVITARTALGTINHSLMTIEALRARKVPLCGIAFIGDSVPDSEQTICRIGRVKRLGRLPIIPSLDDQQSAAKNLTRAFAENFSLSDFDPEPQT